MSEEEVANLGKMVEEFAEKNRREAVAELISKIRALPQREREIFVYIKFVGDHPSALAQMYGVTPEEIVKKANAALVKGVQEPETARRIAAIGWDERPLSPAETLGFIRGEQEKWAPILKQIAETH